MSVNNRKEGQYFKCCVYKRGHYKIYWNSATVNELHSPSAPTEFQRKLRKSNIYNIEAALSIRNTYIWDRLHSKSVSASSVGCMQVVRKWMSLVHETQSAFTSTLILLWGQKKPQFVLGLPSVRFPSPFDVAESLAHDGEILGQLHHGNDDGSSNQRAGWPE